jgi:hypothetical protein
VIPGSIQFQSFVNFPINQAALNNSVKIDKNKLWIVSTPERVEVILGADY